MDGPAISISMYQAERKATPKPTFLRKLPENWSRFLLSATTFLDGRTKQHTNGYGR
jgi:hypothetical protein